MFRIGDRVLFGRANGEQTWGTVVKINPRRIKVRQDESRGTMRDHPVGTIWSVAPALVRPAPVDGAPAAPSAPASAPADPVVGSTVVRIRAMTLAELRYHGWSEGPVVIELSTGAKLYALRDDEGNGPGTLVGVDPAGKYFQVEM